MTRLRWRQAERALVRFFGAERTLTSITAGDAEDFERWLKTGDARTVRYAERKASEGLAPNTVRKRISDAKQFFEDAVRRDLLVKNPFARLKGSVGSNRARDYFLTRDHAAKILAACPDAEWRLIFALSRFGGLRCPSEHLALTWDCIDWERGRLRVPSPKTEHHEGGAERWVPLFPELRPHLEAAFDAAEPDTSHVITRYRSANQNLRTTFSKIIRRAGLSPWPKLFANLRASRATELAAEHPAHVAAAWLGHSTLVANKHYWQVTDAEFDRAAAGDNKAAQNAAQYLHETARNASHAELTAHEKSPVLQGFSAGCKELHTCPVGGTGLEPVTSTV